jgi:aminoglycoside phosphotransferase (APT) family kinase protein
MADTQTLMTGRFTPDDAKDLIQRFALPAVWPGRQLRDLHIERLRFTPGEECTAFCAVTLTGPAGESHHSVTIGFLPEADIAEEVAYQAEIASSRAGQDAILFPAGLGCLIEVFPADRRLVSLGQALSSTDMAPRLAPLLLPEANDYGDFTFEVRTLRYRPHSRCLIAYTFTGRDDASRYEAIGKLYGSKKKARFSASLLTRLSEQSDGTPFTPRVVAFIDKWRLLIMSKVEGRNLGSILSNGSQAESHHALQLAAEALAKLHAATTDTDSIEHKTRAGEIAELKDQSRHFQDIAPDVVMAAKPLIERLEGLSPVGEVKPRLLHGAFKPSQLLIGETFATIVDLDGHGLGDPAFDIGVFEAKVFKDSLDPGRGHLAVLSNRLLDAYVALSDDADIRERALVFEAIALGRLAFRELHTVRRHSRPNDDVPVSAKLLRQAHKRLDQI